MPVVTPKPKTPPAPPAEPAPSKANAAPAAKAKEVEVAPDGKEEEDTEASEEEVEEIAKNDKHAKKAPTPKTPEEVEGEAQEQFLRSPVTRAILSGYFCAKCGAPVDPKAGACHICGGTDAVRPVRYACSRCGRDVSPADEKCSCGSDTMKKIVGKAPAFEGLDAALKRYKTPPEELK